MNTKIGRHTLALNDSPGCFWLFGLFFIFIGALAIYTVIGILSDESYTLWQKGFAFALGVAAVGVGGYITYDAPGSKVYADRDAQVLLLRRRGLLRSEDIRVAAEDIADIAVVRRPDIDGDPVYSLSLQTREGKEIRLTRLWLPNRKKLEENAAAIKDFLQLSMR